MIYGDIQLLINYAVRKGLIKPIDEIVIRNQYMNIFGLSDWEEPEISAEDEGLSVDEILERLIKYTCDNFITEDTANSMDLFDTKLMGVVTPLPHEVHDEFLRRYNSVSPENAVSNYYEYNKNVNYVRAGRIAKDLKWKYESEYGELDITINTSESPSRPGDSRRRKMAAPILSLRILQRALYSFQRKALSHEDRRGGV